VLHEPASPTEKDYAPEYKTRLGVIMFLIYAAIYVGFVAINVVEPTLMEAKVLFGLNLAVVYGFGLIIMALVLAMIYNWLCSAREQHYRKQDTGADKEVA
jgi:uncharacterized membrane protein (DUF485 family)